MSARDGEDAKKCQKDKNSFGLVLYFSHKRVRVARVRVRVRGGGRVRDRDRETE